MVDYLVPGIDECPQSEIQCLADAGGDEDFIALGAMVDSEYYQTLRDRLGLDLEPPERV